MELYRRQNERYRRAMEARPIHNDQKTFRTFSLTPNLDTITEKQERGDTSPLALHTIFRPYQQSTALAPRAPDEAGAMVAGITTAALAPPAPRGRIVLITSRECHDIHDE